MRTFVDTSALFALLDEDDASHTNAERWLTGPGRDPTVLLVTHNYVVVETAALVQRRLAREATRVLFDAYLPAMTVIFVDEGLHQRAASAHVASSGRRPSFVDRVSFEMMRQLRLDQAFAFDRDFATQGFETVPN